MGTRGAFSAKTDRSFPARRVRCHHHECGWLRIAPETLRHLAERRPRLRAPCGKLGPESKRYSRMAGAHRNKTSPGAERQSHQRHLSRSVSPVPRTENHRATAPGSKCHSEPEV